MTLTQLRYIVAIVDAGLNITAAGERVHATQSTISKQLKQLEGELGFRLFTRQGKRLQGATPAGAKVIELARHVVGRTEDIRALAADLRDDANGRLGIVTTHTQARFVLPDVLTSFRERFPGVSVHLQPQAVACSGGRLASADADIGFFSTSGDAVPSGGVAIPVFRWTRVAIAPRDHPLARTGKQIAGIHVLARHPLLTYRSSQRSDSSLQRALAAAGLEGEFAFTSDDADLIKTYVRAGLGVGLLAPMAVRQSDRESLAVRDTAGVLPECTTWLVVRRDRVLRNFTQALVRQVAPWVSRARLRAALDGDRDLSWPEEIPHWSDFEPEGLALPAVA